MQCFRSIDERELVSKISESQATCFCQDFIPLKPTSFPREAHASCSHLIPLHANSCYDLIAHSVSLRPPHGESFLYTLVLSESPIKTSTYPSTLPSCPSFQRNGMSNMYLSRFLKTSPLPWAPSRLLAASQAMSAQDLFLALPQASPLEHWLVLQFHL